MTTWERVVLLVSCWVVLPIGVGALMLSISIRGQMSGPRAITVENPLLFGIAWGILVVAAAGTWFSLFGRRR